MAAIPEVLRLHRARLTEPDVETIDGVRVTTPLRTLIDVMVEGNLAIELQAQAIDEALRRGLIRRRQIEDVAVATAGALRSALETRLLERSRRDAVDLHRLRRQVAFDRLLARLFDASQPARDGWVLKGGYALEMRFHQALATTNSRVKDLVDLVLPLTGLDRHGYPAARGSSTHAYVHHTPRPASDPVVTRLR